MIIINVIIVNERKNDTSDDPYKLQFFNVQSNNIRTRGDFNLLKTYTGERTRDYTLCKQCKEYLIDRDNHPRSTWPCFLWLLLTGSQ